MLVMENTFEKQADYIPYSANEYTFFDTLKNLTTSSPEYWYADETGLQTVGLLTKVLQTVKGFFGWLGFIDYTSVPNVEFGLMKYLYYSYSQGYLRQEGFKEWIQGLRQQPYTFSTITSEMLHYLEKAPHYNLHEKTRAHLAEFLCGYQATYRKEIDSIGGATPVPIGTPFSFGSSPLSLGYQALAQGKVEEALGYGFAAYHLRITNRYESVGNLFLAIANKMETPNPSFLEKLTEFQKGALSQKNYRLSLQYYEAIQKLNPQTPEETNPQVLLEYGRIKRAQGEYLAALSYFTRAQHLGAAGELIDRECGALYLLQGEDQERKGLFKEALGFYELASHHGVEIDDLKKADLYLKAAQESFTQENSRWFSANYSQALNGYETAIHLFSKNKKLSDVLFQGRWFDNYLTALKHHNQLDRGIEKLSHHVNQMIHLIKEEKPLSKMERMERIQQIKPFIRKALQILDLMIYHDPNNPEHPFRKGFLYDYLNYGGESANPLPYYQKAVAIDPENPYYLVSYYKTCWAQHYPTDDTIMRYYQSTKCSLVEYWYEDDRFSLSHSRFEAIY